MKDDDLLCDKCFRLMFDGYRGGSFSDPCRHCKDRIAGQRCLSLIIGLMVAGYVSIAVALWLSGIK